MLSLVGRALHSHALETCAAPTADAQTRSAPICTSSFRPGGRTATATTAVIPTCGGVGPYELAARRDIAAGDELTNDYATSTAEPDFVMPCSCGSGQCRGVVTGNDWRRQDLRDRYGRHWVPALLVRCGPAEVQF
jgi:hypothetical protein